MEDMGDQVSTHPGDLITVTRLGHAFQASRRTVAHLDWTIKRLRRRWPHARLIIIQTCYHSGVEASAGTHDFDACFDFRIVGLPWPLAQRFLRNAGWAAWWRHTGEWAPKDAWHIHAVSIPPGLAGRDVTAAEVGAAYRRQGMKVGKYIDGGVTTEGYPFTSSQVRDFFHRSTGLAERHADGQDTGWFPPNIAKTIYVYNAKDIAA